MVAFENIAENGEKNTGNHQLTPINPSPHMSIRGSSNTAANKNLMSKIWTNGEQLPDQVQNIVGKGEIAHYEHFLLFPECFQNLSVVDV